MNVSCLRPWFLPQHPSTPGKLPRASHLNIYQHLFFLLDGSEDWEEIHKHRYMHQMNPRPLHVAVKFLCEVHMNSSHVMFAHAGFGCEIKSSPSYLCSGCSPLLPLPSGVCVSGADGKKTGASAQGEVPFSPSQSRDRCHLPTSATQLTLSWIPLKR